MFLSRKMKRKFTREEADAIIEKAKTEEPLQLEKNDLKAIMLAAAIVFVPFVLVFVGVMGLMFMFISRIWGG